MRRHDTISSMKKISELSGIKLDTEENPPTEVVAEEKAVFSSASAPQLVHDFLLQNKIKPKLEAIEELNVWVGDGYILNNKPLLKVTYEYSKE